MTFLFLPMQFFIKYINELFYKLLGKELDDKIKTYFVDGTYKSILLQGAIAVLTFCTALFIARVTGDKGFGVYTTVFTWVSIISVVATLGLDDLVLKKLPVYRDSRALSKIKGLLSWANFMGLVFGVVCATLFLLLVNSTSIHGLIEYADYYLWAVWVIPLFVLMHINQAALRGLKFMGWGQFAEKFVLPLAFFILLVIVYFYQDSFLTDEHAIIVRTFSFVLTALVALFLILKFTKAERNKVTAEYEIKNWWGSCRYFAIISLLYIIHTRIDIVILGLFQMPEEQIAFYNAALKLSDIALLPFAVLYTVTAPMYSKLYAANQRAELQLFFTRTTRLAFVVVSAILIILVLGGEWFLSLFGDSFKEGYNVLCVLCLAKFIHVFTGPVNYLLMMVDFEKEAAWTLLASVIITIILHVLWIPQNGIVGAAFATLVGLFCFEILVGYISYKKAGITPTILGAFFAGNNNCSE